MPIRRTLSCIAILGMAAGMPVLGAQEQSFSDWTETSGTTQVEYRWKPGPVKGCDVEYRAVLDRGHRKYKVRVVFHGESGGDEQHQANAVLTFTNGVPTTADHVSACAMITDITVTRW